MNSKLQLEKSWEMELEDEFGKEYMRNLSAYLRQEKSKNKIIFPPGKEIFNAFNSANFNDVKVVILGQDPYHGIGQANGLSFSVNKEVRIPPSLVNIFKELESDLGIKRPRNGNLKNWSEQGVLLLNSILTVEKGKPGSHANIGWEKFTDQILVRLSSIGKNLVFILWGKKAQEKIKIIKFEDNLILTSSHPSPYSASKGFFGSKPFSKTNNYLILHKIMPIDWDLNK